MSRFRLVLIAIAAVVAVACASRTKSVIPVPEVPEMPESVSEQSESGDDAEGSQPVQENPEAVTGESEPAEVMELPVSSRRYDAIVAVRPQARMDAPYFCWIPDKIAEARSMLSGATPKVGTQPIRYSEVRNGVRRTYREPEKEYALAVLRRDSCEIQIVTITKRGSDLVPPEGWEIEVVERSNGIRWNYWNTEFAIRVPSDAVVIGNVEPFARNITSSRRIRTADGGSKLVRTTKRSVEYRQYVPYSRDLHSDLLVEIGEEYLRKLVARAYDHLRTRKVMSRAIPGTQVAEVRQLTPVMFERLPLIEGMDIGEFLLEPERIVERVYVIVATNEGSAFGLTCSSKGACGMYQFTDNGPSGTYTTIRRRYLAAELNKDFTSGAQDHLNIAVAAILLHDNNLRLLIDEYGEAVLDDPNLEEYLAALYNASPRSVLPAIRKGRSSRSPDWAVHLPSRIKAETGGYIAKLRYLVARDADE